MRKEGKNYTHPLFYIEEDEWAHGDLYDLEVDYIYTVVCKKTEEVVMKFTSTYSAEYGTGGGGWKGTSFVGVNDIQFSEDGKHLLVFKSGSKKPKKIKLPKCE